MATENLLIDDVTYDVEARWETWETGILIYHVGIVFKQARNIAMTPLRVSEKGDHPREAMHRLVMLINDLRLAGVLKKVPDRRGLYFDSEVDIHPDLRERLSL